MNTYSAAVPLSARTYYRPSETVDFTLSAGPGMAIVAGSIRICGNALFSLDYTDPAPAAVAANTANVLLDGMTGAHGFFRQMVVETANQGVLQNLQDYPRALADLRNATQTTDMCFNTNQKDLATGIDGFSCNAVGGNNSVQSFCINPEICINRSRGVNIQSSKTGDIKLSLVLNTGKGCMYGAGVTATTGFVLQNLECHYRVVPDNQPKPVAKLEMLSMATVKAVADGNLAAFNIISPMPSYSLSANFITLADENTLTTNSLSLEQLPGLYRVEITFSDSNNQILQYPLENLAEMQKFWVDSYGSSRYNPNAFGLGVAYNQVLSNTKFGIVIQSAIATSTACYFIFKGTVVI